VCFFLLLFGALVIDYGIVTTPELHFLVRKSNLIGSEIEKNEYVDHIVVNFKEIAQYNLKNEKVMVDCASGVGGILLDKLKDKIDGIDIDIINISKEEKGYVPDNQYLNNCCGADYIISKNMVPNNISVKNDELKRCASFDGDADRLIYFSNDKKLEIMNGDRIAVFLGIYIKNMINGMVNKRIGVVLSHYSNTGAINFLNEKNICVSIANTGVKNFVKLSREFDVGIFFEPNGHGSVTFSDKIISEIDEMMNNENEEKLKNAKILKAMVNLFDPCIGDAIANFLVLEGIFLKDTFESTMNLYKEMPTRMLAVKINDKSIFKIQGDVEIIEPLELKENIKQFMQKFRGRCFVRPSGTEDIVRVFAEGERREDCDLLAVNVAQAVYDICDGIGAFPEIKY